MNRTLKVHVALFLVSLIYAATFTIAKEVMPLYVKPYAFIALRVWVAAILLFVFQSIFIKERIHDKADYKKLFICAIFGMGANMLLFFKGLSLTVPINGAVLMMNTPIFVVVFATLVLKEKLTTSKIAGIILAALGAILLMGGTNFSFNSQTVLGDVMVTANAIIYAYYLVYAKPLSLKYHPLTVTLFGFLFGALLVTPFAWNELMEISWTTIPLKMYGYIIFITVGSTFVTYVLNAYALRYASPSLVGSYIYLQPVLAALIAIVSGKDALTWQKAIFIGIISTGVYLVSKKSSTVPLTK
jgi:drug/metabolite transporter (DMT)-like permease